MRRDAPATHRNREPIAAVLARWLREPARVLELASGTGQHAAFFAERMPHVVWQPTDVEDSALASIDAWATGSRVPNVARAIRLDAREVPWPVEVPDAPPFDALFNANMIHIAPWPVAEGLFAGAGRLLAPGGLVFLYGPFRVGGEHTAPSNAAFDADLRRRNPEWGVRDREAVIALAEAVGFVLREANALPANNQLLVFERMAG
ncbi:MAG: DUF938 domain-containing protein [Spirochaetaceae bacterium]|nr:DUF938 domain-containing protein [Myxococcales bacterium]MCB9726423.1 DUF938 domain-containing protein [Spirochaetaceae bacterium]HPG24210.1 DUF938 domain-containing protein [Myxococcota bacterium]